MIPKKHLAESLWLIWSFDTETLPQTVIVINNSFYDIVFQLHDT